MKQRLALAALVALAAPGALAYRPFDSTDAAVADRGDLEIELGPIGWQRAAGQDLLVAPALVVNWGFAERFELVLEAKQFHALDSSPRYRLDDAAISLKTVLRRGSLQDASGPSMAFELGALLPAIHGDSGAGASAALIVSQRWPALTLHLNGAALWTRAHQPGFSAGLIAEGPGSWTVRPVAEILLEGERDAGTGAFVLAGAIWPVAEGLALDAAVRWGRESAGHTQEVRLGLTWAFSLGVPR